MRIEHEDNAALQQVMTSEKKYILDNRNNTVADYLRDILSNAKSFRIVSAYFTIYGFELVESLLWDLESTKFLFGDPDSVDNLDPSNSERKTYTLREGLLTPDHQLRQSYLAKRCEEWIKQDHVEIRSVVQSGLLHGKMYLTENSNDDLASIVGSSNFTKRGLGDGNTGNIEINLALKDQELCSELGAWFDELWQSGDETEDVKQVVIDALRQLGKEYSPEFVYYKTLYEIFRDEINARLEQNELIDDTRLTDTKIWQELWEFQKDGALTAISRLQRHNGCIIADSVGLGKTYTALAVIKFFELRNSRVLVLCPKKLIQNWNLFLAAANSINNPFLEDKFSYVLLAHTDLSRETGKEGNVDFSNFNWSNFDLVVIDESHNFRNDTSPKREQGKVIRHSRYSKLMDVVLSEGTNTKVLMLSATPVNTSLNDLKNQINLMTTNRNDALSASLGISSISSVLKQADKTFEKWAGTKKQQKRKKKIKPLDKSKLLSDFSADFIRLLGGVTIARSRRQIKKYYSYELDKLGSFPDRNKPINRSPKTDLNGNFSYKNIAKEIDNFKLSVYQPSSYIVSEEAKQRLEEEREKFNFNQKHREKFLVGMIRTNYLKRLESSANSLSLTLDRAIKKIDDTIKRIDHFLLERLDQGDVATSQAYEDLDDDDFVVYQSRTPLYLKDLNLSKWKKDLEKDKKTLTNVYDKVSCITPERDGKLQKLKKDIRNRANNPTENNLGIPIRKILVFTVFTDTAIYLYENLKELAEELELNMALVSGSILQSQIGENKFDQILANFSPRSIVGSDSTDSDDEIDVLIATDCISEGQNLQDCDTVLNYDIHWNPIKLIQRFGRIDRIGSKFESIQMINYWPTKKLENYLTLKSRVYSRMAMADLAGTGDDDLLNLETKRLDELRFRDSQLELLKDEVPDLDELSESVVMSDFTLDDFFSQLMQYLRNNRKELENAPNGLYAVTTNSTDAPNVGVIFALRQRSFSDSKNNKNFTSPVHPIYLVYVRDDGDIRFSCGSVKSLLDVYSTTTFQRNSPLNKLCRKFDTETNMGQDMSKYDGLLFNVIKSIRNSYRNQELLGLKSGSGKGFKVLKLKDKPISVDRFELLSWLIIMQGNNG